MKNGYQPKDNGKPLYPPTTGSNVYYPKYEDVEGDPMTYQEAYKIIQDSIKIQARKNGRDIPDLFFVVSAALEKQIPKKPIKEEWDNICPTCSHPLIDEAEDINVYYPYCFRCGQRLDWNEK